MVLVKRNMRNVLNSKVILFNLNMLLFYLKLSVVFVLSSLFWFSVRYNFVNFSVKWLRMRSLLMFFFLCVCPSLRCCCVSINAAVVDRVSSSTPVRLSENVRQPTTLQSSMEASITADRPASADLLTSTSKRGSVASSVAVDGRTLFSQSRSLSVEAVTVAADVSPALPGAPATSRAGVGNKVAGKAPEIIYQRRRQRLKKRSDVSGDRHQTAPSAPHGLSM